MRENKRKNYATNISFDPEKVSGPRSGFYSVPADHKIAYKKMERCSYDFERVSNHRGTGP